MTMYFERASLWNREPEPYQIQARESILGLIPGRVRSILDVGCGDGFVTNALPEHLYVVGLDISSEALKHVRRQTILGSIDSLPFDDGAFDFVMANDTLEHLPDETYARGVGELFRVARDYVLITVPYAEQLERSQVRCDHCGQYHHVNMHFRSFTESCLRRLAPTGWYVCELQYTGDVTRPPIDRSFELWSEFLRGEQCSGAKCPICGVATPSRPTGIIIDHINSLRGRSVYSNGPHTLVDRSEVSVLYCRNAEDGSLVISEPSFVEQSLLLADILNPLQHVRGFVEASQWTRFDINTNGQEQTFWLQFPVMVNKGEHIVVKTQAGADIAKVVGHGHDPILHESVPLGRATDGSFYIEEPWPATKFGSIISFRAPINAIRSIEYMPLSSGERYNVPFMRIPEGRTVISGSGDSRRSWSFVATSPGIVPKPLWLYSPNVDASSLSPAEPPQPSLVLSQLEAYVLQVESQRNSLNRLLNETEARRDAVEKSYALREVQQNQEVQALLDRIAALEADKAAERAYMSLSGTSQKPDSPEVVADDRRVPQKTNKVLVISHLFPNQAQPNLGCFVADQVKALRQYEGIDARVITCVPFWCNTVNPLRIVRGLHRLRKLLRSARWFEHQGIPMLQLHYLVGLPLWPFEFHANTYRSAVATVIDEVRRDFAFDLVHAHTGYEDGHTGLFVAERYGVPLVITEHTGPFSRFTSRPLVRRLALRAISLAQKVICVSPALQAQVAKWVEGSNLMSIPNCIDTEFFRPAEVDTSGGFRILSVISLDSNKNPLGLLQAFRLVRSRLVQAKLTILGGGPMEDQVRHTVRELGLEQSVELLGWQPREEVARQMRECDVFVLPSHSETFAVVVAEALASGKPVVSTRCGGPESIISDPKLGELVPVNDPKALAKAIEKVLENPNLYPCEYIRSEAIRRFSQRHVARAVSEVYQAAIEIQHKRSSR